MKTFAAPALKSSAPFVNGRSSIKRLAPSQPGNRRCPPIHASSSKSTKVELEALARDILEKENALKNAFQPGSIMPTGREVAAMRTEVQALREVLATKLEAAAGEEAAGDDFSTNKEISALITSVAAARARESLSAMKRSVDAAAPEALFLEDGTVLEEHEVLELEMLQLQNEELRKQASLLLMRQHFLEELMHENSLAVPLPPAPEQAGSESESEDKGYFMSSPSYY